MRDSANKYKRLAANTVILGLGTFSSKVLVLLLMPLYTSILSKAEFGVADLISQSANLIIPLACVGISDGMFRFALDSPDKKRVFTNGMLILSLGTAAFFLFTPALMLFDDFTGYRILIIAYVLFANIHSVTAHYLRAAGKTTLFAAQGIANTILCVIFNIVFLIVFDMGVLGYVLSVVAADFVISVFLIIFAKLYRDFDFSLRDRRTFGEMLCFSAPYIPTTMLWLIINTSGRFFLNYYRGNDEVGLYAAALKIPTLLMLVSGVFIEAWQFSAVKDSDKTEREVFFSAINKGYTAVIVIAASGIILFAKVFTKILLADSYFSAWKFIPVLAISAVFMALVSFMGSVYFVEKKSFLSMVTALTGAVINVFLNFILVPNHGAMGAAVAMLISYIAVYAIRAYDTRRFIRMSKNIVLLTVNAMVLTMQAFFMLRDNGSSVYISATFFALLLIINAPALIKSAVKLIDSLRKRK